MGLIPGLGRSPGGGHGNPLQYSCPEKPTGQRSLAGYSPRGCKESDTTEATQPARTLILSMREWSMSCCFMQMSLFSAGAFLILTG